MRNKRIITVLLVVVLLTAALLALRSFDVFGAVTLGEVKAVVSGDQEIAWIAPATSSETWERVVAAVHSLEDTWSRVHSTRPALRADYRRAFLDLTADVPEIALRLGEGASRRLWLRWYKVSSEVHARAWIQKLARREVPPLAIIGGDTSDHALHVARMLRDARSQWHGLAPLFLITTATADRYDPGESPNADLARQNWPKLMEIYKDRSFRFSFTNTRMAGAVMDFAQSHPEVWSDRDATFLAALAGLDPWQALALLAAEGRFQCQALYTLSWNDDRYSLDLSDRFVKVFTDTAGPTGGAADSRRIVSDKVDYSVGDYYQPNPSEAFAVGRFLLERAERPFRRQLLALPTGAQPARRFLRTLVRRAPLDARKLVVLTGDSINFNTIYRDRDIAWNVLEMPVPLIVFSHRNPIDRTAGFREQPDADHPAAATGTQDLLLHRDLMEAVVEAAFDGGRLLDNADTLDRRLRQSYWKKGRIFVPEDGERGSDGAGVPLFDEDGDRHARTGEHIVWLRPVLEGDRTLPQSQITVWRLRSDDANSGWRQISEPLLADYERGR
jgi:hypothetical protein